MYQTIKYTKTAHSKYTQRKCFSKPNDHLQNYFFNYMHIGIHKVGNNARNNIYI